MEIRNAKLCDLPDVGRIHALSWKTAYAGIVPQDYLDHLEAEHWTPRLAASLESGALKEKLILLDGRPVGCCGYGASREPSFAGWGEIVSLYLMPEVFGQGYGAALFTSVLGDLYEAGYHDIFLWVLKENLRAQRFYARHGFVASGDACTVEISGKTLTDLRFVHRQA